MNKLIYEESQRNAELAFHANKIRPAVEAWAKAQSSSVNAAYARADFENAVLEAVIGHTAEWQHYTNAELCSALGHNTLARVVDTTSTVERKRRVIAMTGNSEIRQ